MATWRHRRATRETRRNGPILSRRRAPPCLPAASCPAARPCAAAGHSLTACRSARGSPGLPWAPLGLPAHHGGSPPAAPGPFPALPGPAPPLPAALPLPCCPAALPASLGSPLLPAAPPGPPWHHGGFHGGLPPGGGPPRGHSLARRGPFPDPRAARPGECLKLWTVRPNENAPRPKPRGAVFRRGR